MSRTSRAALLLLGLAWTGPGCETSSGGEAGFSPEECSDACAKLAAAACGDVGSSCFDNCVSYPQAQFQGVCQVELRQYFDCWWKADQYMCDAKSQTTPVGCDAQHEAFLSCSSPGEGGAGGADAGSAGAPDAAAAGAGGTTEMAGAAGASDVAGVGGVAGAEG